MIRPVRSKSALQWSSLTNNDTKFHAVRSCSTVSTVQGSTHGQVNYIIWKPSSWCLAQFKQMSWEMAVNYSAVASRVNSYCLCSLMIVLLHRSSGACWENSWGWSSDEEKDCHPSTNQKLREAGEKTWQQPVRVGVRAATHFQGRGVWVYIPCYPYSYFLFCMPWSFCTPDYISIFQETYPHQHILMLIFIGSLLCSDYSGSLFACMFLCCTGAMFRTGTPFILCDFGLDIHNDK